MDPPVENDKTEDQKIDLSPMDDGHEICPLVDFGEKSDVQLKSSNSTSSSSSSSSSSDNEEDDDFIQLEGTELGKPVSSGDVASSSLSSPPLFGDGPLAPESNTQGDGPPSGTQNPGLQQEQPNFPENLGIFQPAEPLPPAAEVMVRSDVPDPYRIPSSVFERSKSTAPMEWSVASNDSLFSIHMGGNSSFSRDHAILLGMSGELSSLPLPDLKNDPVQPLTTGEPSSELTNSGAREPIDSEKPPPRSSTSSTPRSYESEASTTSSNSFAFPILTKGPSGSMKAAEPQKQNSPQELKQPEGNEPQKPVVGSMAWWKTWCSCCSCTNCS